LPSSKKNDYYVNSVSDLEDEKLQCRAFGHRWEQGPVQKLNDIGLEVWTIHLRCPCGKSRFDYVTPGTFELEMRRYTDPSGYGVIEPAAREDFREEAVKRQRTRQKDKDVPFDSVLKWLERVNGDDIPLPETQPQVARRAR
jgi:hypothetical protein